MESSGQDLYCIRPLSTILLPSSLSYGCPLQVGPEEFQRSAPRELSRLFLVGSEGVVHEAMVGMGGTIGATAGLIGVRLGGVMIAPWGMLTGVGAPIVVCTIGGLWPLVRHRSRAGVTPSPAPAPDAAPACVTADTDGPAG